MKQLEFKRENKYLVLKWDDIDKYLTPKKDELMDMREILMWIVKRLDAARENDGKKLNTYVVVNEDESYAEGVWKLVEDDWHNSIHAVKK